MSESDACFAHAPDTATLAKEYGSCAVNLLEEYFYFKFKYIGSSEQISLLVFNIYIYVFDTISENLISIPSDVLKLLILKINIATASQRKLS